MSEGTVSQLYRFVGRLGERPVLTVLAGALAIRLVVVVAANLLYDGPLVPDEGFYLIIALLNSEGELTAGFWGGYGLTFLHSTRTFMWPLTALFWLFGPSRFVAQLLPALFGAVTAALTTAVAGRVLRRRYALVAGLVVALFPSQVLWSSVVLRESLVWACLAGIALAVSYSLLQGQVIRILGSALMASVMFWALAGLREQTAALALWCLFPALLVGRGHRVVRVVSAVCVLVVAPWMVGMGPGAATFAEEALTRTGISRCYMSMEADSGFGGCVGGVAGGAGGAGGAAEREFKTVDECIALLAQETGGWREIGDTAGRLLDRERGDWLCVGDYSGGAFLIDNRIRTGVSRIPSGLFHTMIRPLPWEARWDKPGMLVAGLESVLWVALYGLCVLGIWNNRKRLQLLLFPILIAGAITFSGAATHGNLGTAFRHRGQLLFAFAILSAGGLQAIADRHNGRRPGRGTVESVDIGD